MSETLAGQVDIIELGTFKTNEYFGLELPGFYHIFKQKITEETKEVLKQHKTSTTSKISLTFLLCLGLPPFFKKRSILLLKYCFLFISKIPLSMETNTNFFSNPDLCKYLLVCLFPTLPQYFSFFS